MITTLFSNQLDLLAQEIEQKSNYDLQNSTCSETLNEDENLTHYDIFEVFEVIYFLIYNFIIFII